MLLELVYTPVFEETKGLCFTLQPIRKRCIGFRTNGGCSTVFAARLEAHSWDQSGRDEDTGWGWRWLTGLWGWWWRREWLQVSTVVHSNKASQGPKVGAREQWADIVCSVVVQGLKAIHSRAEATVAFDVQVETAIATVRRGAIMKCQTS
jgi:hypothetical protein